MVIATVKSLAKFTAILMVVAIIAPGGAARPMAVDDVIVSGTQSGTMCFIEDQSFDDAAWALAVTASAEARSEGLIGMTLTMEVMMNRICAGKRSYGGASARGVVTHPWAFSVYNHDSHVREHLYELLDGDQKTDSEIERYARKILPVAEAILLGWRSGMLPYETDDCRHYKTYWAKASWAKSEPVLRYGDHEFYCSVDP